MLRNVRRVPTIIVGVIERSTITVGFIIIDVSNVVIYIKH